MYFAVKEVKKITSEITISGKPIFVKDAARMTMDNHLEPQILTELESQLKNLSKEDETFLKIGLASNLNLPRELFEKFSTDKNDEVREKVASNSAIPKSILTKLVNDQNDSVKDTVRNALKEGAHDWYYDSTNKGYRKRANEN